MEDVLQAVRRPEGLLQATRRSFSDLADQLSGSLLYTDSGAAEFIQTSLSYAYLRELGVAHVAELEKASVRDAAVSKLMSGRELSTIAIFTAQLLTDVHGLIIRALKAHPFVRRCVVLSSVPEGGHASHSGSLLGTDSFKEYKSLLSEDIGEVRAKAAIQQETDPVSLEVEIRHVPLHACTLDNSTFVLPATSTAASLTRASDAPAGFGMPKAEESGSDDDDAESEGVAGVRMLAHTLVGMAAQLGLRLDTFTLGPTARLAGAEVAALPVPPGPNGRPPTEAAALLLLDRSLDLATPAGHGEHLLDRALGCLPRRAPSASRGVLHSGMSGTQQSWARVPWRSADVLLPMDQLCEPSAADTAAVGAGGSEPPEPGTPTPGPSACGVPGGLFHGDDKQAGQWWAFLVSRPPRDAALFLRKWLREALRKEDAQPTARFKAGAVPLEELRALTAALAALPGAAVRHGVLLQLATAAVEGLGGARAAEWDALAGHERRLDVLLDAEGPEGALNHLLELLQSASSSAQGAGQPPIRLRDVLLLALRLYCRASESALLPTGPSPLTAAQERQLKEALVEAVAAAGPVAGELGWLEDLQPRSASGSVPEGAGEGQSGGEVAEDEQYRARAARMELEDKVEEVMGQLRQAAAASSSIHELRHAGGTPSGEQGPPPLLQQLIGRILQQQPISGLGHATASIRGLLKSGLNRFGIMQKQPHPGSYPTLLVFVVGGIAMPEVRAVRQQVEEHAAAQKRAGGGSGAGPRVLLGGTSLLAPDDVYDRVFVPLQ